ncbi:hypothetical protein SRB5_02090 [Streptomyces sp. RB5]|uniref:DUF1214 domain-containing protein n=1 Tax=Streptomyces smaragdinus TaxID=2585196 RepID=A0A7K0CBE7_9ACTN|nr:DUF1214 domain-containing protein [Streptomyces smaragdinus]MQY10104.1 hypothetical protein [Streptomyces smaragdinus]
MDPHLFENSVGDRTPGLGYADDGSLELLLQHERPQNGAGNWLPAAVSGG